MNTLPPTAEMERAYLESNAAYNGIFFLGVRTTAIFCRPTCPARKPLPKNVEFFSTPQEALFAGYRPCKRCKPLELDDQPSWAADLLAEVDKRPNERITESELRRRGVDPATVRRYFARRFGMTFQAYSRGRRLTGAFQEIRNGKRLDDAAIDSGYESTSGFRDAFAKTFGSTPGDREHGPCVFLSWMKSPLGPLVAGATDEGICLLEFTDRRMLEAQFTTIRRRFRGPVAPGEHRHLKALETELAEYFAGSRTRFDVPLVHPGTPFQEIVWKELLKIPYGETRSYEELATSVGIPTAVRAVGRANGMNRIAIVIPCHRVVRKTGELGGYGGGLRRKQFLLEMERKNK
jgi:AraC family transcriptional regulator, regulatory protein of adaptative response / methylated-DNA-[protein]-cysteine methyltransferase